MKNKKKVIWAGTIVACDVCGQPIRTEFYDACLRPSLRWGIACVRCFASYGIGVGTGQGQHYQYDDSIKGFIKIDG